MDEKLTSAGCDRCHGTATLKATWSSGSNLLCDGCFADGQAETDEVEAYEMATFGGAWGIPERPHVQRLARAALSVSEGGK
ncbi:hypothetical protein [Bosea vaviloviae]|uniref:Uncharacterized protein n=1 Tax=Bosea vaviloviae TaxID=1526658 RepID=A0A0N0M882_9HYPH|nr:hypothetical protein [Bosea vaviloviae]KPH74069.1 hypothetical protein AE618_25970 [Bosea vaviloviae]